jgi:HK97 family phage major capsid protein
MMNDASVKVIRKIKDGHSRPIFVPGYEFAIPTDGKAGGIPDTLLGDPIQVNQDIATMAANAKSILYGDFSYYTIRDALDVQMFRFTDSAFTPSSARSASSPSCARAASSSMSAGRSNTTRTAPPKTLSPPSV